MHENDGVYGLVPREKMRPAARKLRDAYAITPNAPLLQREFGFFCFDRWIAEGHIDPKYDGWSYDDHLRELFGYDEESLQPICGLGWTEAEFYPFFEEEVIEDRGEHEVVRDRFGRHVLYFKGRRNGFMPEYIDHPVKDMKSWEENCKWRLDPKTPERYIGMDAMLAEVKKSAAEGLVVQQRISGAYMYLRSLIGPEELFYKFYDEPELIHACMQTWLELADVITAKHQEQVTFDELFFGEDICYNHGPLISPDMIREFLMPYYQQLITNIRRRQLDKSRHLYIQIDTDGYCVPAIPIYQEMGMDIMSPFEVASGCDVVKIGQEYPELVMTGGIDKRVLAEGKEAIDRHLDYILPAMKKRGGYIPTCDHGVPEEVSFENYLYFRKKMLEYA